MQLSYYRAWFRAKKIACEVLTEDGARRAYETRTLYTAVIGDPERPECFVESNRDYVGVEFLDHLLREHIAYQYLEVRPGTLFLSMAVRRYYVGDTDEVKCGAGSFSKKLARHSSTDRTSWPEFSSVLSSTSMYRKTGQPTPGSVTIQP